MGEENGDVQPLVWIEQRRGTIAHDKEKEEKRERVEGVKEDGRGLEGECDQISHGQSHWRMRCREGNEDASFAWLRCFEDGERDIG